MTNQTYQQQTKFVSETKLRNKVVVCSMLFLEKENKSLMLKHQNIKKIMDQKDYKLTADASQARDVTSHWS